MLMVEHVQELDQILSERKQLCCIIGFRIKQHFFYYALIASNNRCLSTPLLGCHSKKFSRSA